MTAFRSLLNLLPAIIAGAIMLASPVGWAGTVPERLVGSHHMVAFAWSTTDQSQFDEEARRWKEAGFDFVVLHMDAYDSGYPDQLRRYYDAAAKVGIKCIPSWSWFYWATYTDENGNPDPEYPGRVWIPQIVRDTRDHPAQFKIDGVPVYSGYNFPWYSKEMLEAAGEWPVIFWPHMYYYDPAVGNTLHATNDPDRIRAMYDTFPWLSGLCNFSGDMSLQTIIDLNHVLNEVGRERGKWTMAGVTAFYGSHNLHDYGGYQGVAAQWAAILQDQPNAVWWVTTNDWNELSYVADLPESPVWTNHWNKHHMADPLDHSGYRKFAEPYLAAYKAGLTTPVITRDRLFICYQLHPKDVEPIAGSPDHMYGGRTWRSQLPDRIFVAAHLTAPARLKINDTLSEEFPAGIAHFDIPLTVGPAPHVAIVRNGTEVKAGDAPLPITDSPEVGAWNYLAVEIAPDADATPITTPPSEPAPDPTPAPDPEPTPAPSPTPPAATPIPDDYESWVWPRSEQFTQLADYYFTWGRESVTGALTWTPDSFPAASVKYITNDGQDATITLSDTFPVGTSLLLNAKFWSFGKRIIFAAQNGTTIKYITAEGSEAAANTNAAGEIWIHLERRSDGWAFEWAGAGWKDFSDPVFAISGGRHTTANGYTRPARYSSYVRGGYSVRFHSNARRIYLYLHLNATQFRVIANGVVTHEAVDDPARPQGTWGVFPIDFGSSAERDIEILFDNDTPFIGVMAPPSLGTITPWAGEPWRATMAVIGDSICEGGTRGYAWSAAHLLNLDAIVSPMGSTGYVDPGFISGYPHDFQTRLEADILQHEPDIVLISGGINDQSHPADDQNDPAAFEAAVRSVFTRVDERLPNAIKVALSPFWPNENFAPVNVEYTRIVQRVAAERGWHFIDFRTIPNDLTDRLISGDGVHPTREGWAYLGAQLAEDLAPIIGGTVQPAPAPDTPASEPAPDPAPEPTPAPTPPASSDRAPYLETPAAIPGRIEAEHFDLGGEGIAYADTTAQNEGGALRSEGVDLETHPAGINIGWFRPGEWIGYTVNIVQAGDYALTLRVACLGAGGRLKLTLDGADLTDPIQIPDTGAWDAWTSLTTTVSLPEGQHDLRIVGIDTANAFNAVANVDWIAFEALPPPVTTPPPDPEPAPEPTPAPSPEPSPAPEPEPSPTPEPEPPVVILPDPPSSTPDPEPQPEPPSVEPTPEPEPAPAPSPAPQPQPEPEPQPDPEPEPPAVVLPEPPVSSPVPEPPSVEPAPEPTPVEPPDAPIASPDPIVAPGTDGIAVSWERPAGAERFEIWQGFSPERSLARKIGETTGTEFSVSADQLLHGGNLWIVGFSGTEPISVSRSRLAAPGAPPPDIKNLSTRITVRPDTPLVTGFVLQGSEPRRILIRAVGPGLEALGVASPAEAPHIHLESINDPDWSLTVDTAASAATREELLAAFAEAGAFIPEGEWRDAALVAELPPGAYTATVSDASPRHSGPILLEFYTLDAEGALQSADLINISSRGYSGSGTDTLIAGLVIDGDQPEQVLIRGIGPALAKFKIPAPAPDPILRIYRDGEETPIAVNEAWDADPQNLAALEAAFDDVGAFRLDHGSGDTALLLNLSPGVYTVHLSAGHAAAGTGLIEIYRIP